MARLHGRRETYAGERAAYRWETENQGLHAWHDDTDTSTYEARRARQGNEWMIRQAFSSPDGCWIDVSRPGNLETSQFLGCVQCACMFVRFVFPLSCTVCSWIYPFWIRTRCFSRRYVDVGLGNNGIWSRRILPIPSASGTVRVRRNSLRGIWSLLPGRLLSQSALHTS